MLESRGVGKTEGVRTAEGREVRTAEGSQVRGVMGLWGRVAEGWVRGAG